MIIYVDADACPNPIKEIIFRAAKRTQLNTVLMANHGIAIPPSPYIKFIQVPGGFDVVDKLIVEKVTPGDLVITADIPLAADVVGKGALAINPRGEIYTNENVQHRLRIRNEQESLRGQGKVTRGPAPLNHRDKASFANALDKLLADRMR